MTEHAAQQPERELPDGVDDVLASLVESINLNGDGYLSVILTVAGHVVSGRLISGSRFFEMQIERWVEAGGDAAHWPANIFGRRGAGYAEQVWDDDPDVEVSVPDAWPVFVHLKDAVIHQQGSRINIGLWRGKIAEVNGFSLGQLGDPEAD